MFSDDEHPYADLEIRILAAEDEGYPVEITFSGEREFPAGRLSRDIVPWLPGVSAREDGERLFTQLFGDPRLARAWSEARGESERRRLRLRIDAGAPELHAVPWELLRETLPDEAPRYLAAQPETPFSRYLAGAWRAGRPVLERPVRALVAISNPCDLGERGLEPLAAETERRQIEEFLDAIEGEDTEVVFLEPPITLAALEAALRYAPHILHLVAHGAWNAERGKAALVLENGEGRSELVREDEIGEMLGRQSELPRLVFLAACQSATRSPADAFRGLAPRLVAAGVPAVLAMQDVVPIDTARTFAATFYRQLLTHGRADLAANEARSALLTSELPGAAVPVLFLRLHRPRLFDRPGQVLGRHSKNLWTTLLGNIAEGECTPILGPGVTRGLLPEPFEIARRLARRYNYPFDDADSLPRVAQFVASLDQLRLRRDVVKILKHGFQAWHGLSPCASDVACNGEGLLETIAAAGWPGRVPKCFEAEVHQLLADLGLPLYLTTNFDNFMTLALEGRGLCAHRDVLPWRTDPADVPDGGPRASREEPLVLHLFGSEEDPRSMVLTEDDHLEFLSRLARGRWRLLPPSLRQALERNSFLILGFDVRSLELRVLLHALLGSLGLSDRMHVAVLLETHGGDPEEIKRFLEDDFENLGVDVYWGGVQQFVTELHARFVESGAGG